MSQKLKNKQGPQNQLRSTRSPETVTLCVPDVPVRWRDIDCGSNSVVLLWCRSSTGTALPWCLLGVFLCI